MCWEVSVCLCFHRKWLSLPAAASWLGNDVGDIGLNADGTPAWCWETQHRQQSEGGWCVFFRISSLQKAPVTCRLWKTANYRGKKCSDSSGEKREKGPHVLPGTHLLGTDFVCAVHGCRSGWRARVAVWHMSRNVLKLWLLPPCSDPVCRREVRRLLLHGLSELSAAFDQLPRCRIFCFIMEIYQDTFKFSLAVTGHSSTLASWASLSWSWQEFIANTPHLHLCSPYCMYFCSLHWYVHISQCQKKQKEHRILHKWFILINTQSTLTGITKLHKNALLSSLFCSTPWILQYKQNPTTTWKVENRLIF